MHIAWRVLTSFSGELGISVEGIQRSISYIFLMGKLGVASTVALVSLALCLHRGTIMLTSGCTVPTKIDPGAEDICQKDAYKLVLEPVQSCT
ncbi:unnamed protein product [Protopolystoma xenopodis]|uniref:Uncharacterized protein n=1 Tax=Protopolystoma xenopodis TaxID=117903 RepID=A0A3S5CRE6_9PLAT|nr:unnamed protein product [Protopolystoma xenopodis]